jgi:EAL domain-containing protein (putative c-di-GMP-specific phosphodiesterase class I)
MTRLIHLIYSSAAKTDFSPNDLLALLASSRSKNTAHNISGMLLHIEGSFLQVIEGQEADIDQLFETISADPRHGNITTIIRESIARRVFADWSMGFADVKLAEIDAADGFNAFLQDGGSVLALPPGRAQKLLTAFKDGRWRSRQPRSAGANSQPATAAPSVDPLQATDIAFQPIISASGRSIWSQEALAWDTRMQRELTALDHDAEPLSKIEALARERAMLLSAEPDSIQNININVRPTSPQDAVATMRAIIDLSKKQDVQDRQITLELNQDYLNGDVNSIIAIVQDCKENQLNICLDHFGAGRSGLNQIEMSQPNSIALNAKLVRDIDTNGAKQAIIRGLMQTCDDLGIDVIAKHVETSGEYAWLASEGIDLFQGGLFGNPQLGSMPTTIRIP